MKKILAMVLTAAMSVAMVGASYAGIIVEENTQQMLDEGESGGGQMLDEGESGGGQMLDEGESGGGQMLDEGESGGGQAIGEGESGGDSANANQEAAPTPSVAGAEDVTVLMANANNILVYWPANNIADEMSLQFTCTAPVLLVFGDGAFDADSARTYAIESGLADIAASEGSSVVFVNPVEEAWSEADVDVYSAIVDLIGDSSTDSHAKGITDSFNYFTQSTSQKITGTTQRIYVYGIGTGADFVAENILKEINGSVTYGDGVTIEFNNTIAGATLVNVSDVSSVETNDIPVVSVGNSEEINAALEEKCGFLYAEETGDFISEYINVIGTNRRQAGVLIHYYNWDEEGITQLVETFVVGTSSDNVTFAGQAEHEVNVVVYYANDLDVANGNVPLVLCFHGGGNTALYEAQATAWPITGRENGFITASVDLHYPNCTATEIVAIINALEEEYSIDPSRIYASGFSMGGCMSWDLYEQYPEVFAGLAPMDASNNVANDSFGNPVENTNDGVLVPVFYVAGELSPLAEMPCQDQKLIDRMGYILSNNGCTAEYNVAFDDQENWADPFWGIAGDETYEVEDTVFTDSVLTVNLFASEDGNCYTAFALSGNQSHEVYARNSRAAWEFLSKFSRNAEGGIDINK